MSIPHKNIGPAWRLMHSEEDSDSNHGGHDEQVEMADIEDEREESDESGDNTQCPLFFVYDCEGTGGSMYDDHIVEIAAAIQAPLGITTKAPTEFQSLVRTSKKIKSIVSRKCGVMNKDLQEQPVFSEILPKFLAWIKEATEQINTATKKNHQPVLLAHNGFHYDFPILCEEIQRAELDINVLSFLEFGDTLVHIREVKKSGKFPKLTLSKVGLESLYKSYFPDEGYNAHRALEDVKAMKRVLFETELAPEMPKILRRNFDMQRSSWQRMKAVRTEAKKLLYKLGEGVISGVLAKKLASSGLPYDKLKLAAKEKTKEQFCYMLQQKKFSKKTQKKLTDYFYA